MALDDQTTVVGILSAGLAAVSGVVSVLWRKVERSASTLESQYIQTTKDLIECREDRAKLHASHEVLKQRLDDMEGKCQ